MAERTPVSEETIEEYFMLIEELDKVGWASGGGGNLVTGEVSFGAYLADELRTVNAGEVAVNSGFADVDAARQAGYDIQPLHDERFDGVEVGYDGPLNATHIRVLARLAYSGIPYEEEL